MNWKCRIGRHDWQYNGFTARFEPYGDVFFISERLCVECEKRQEIYGMQVRSKQFNTWLKLPGKSTIFGKTSYPLYNPQSSTQSANEEE